MKLLWIFAYLFWLVEALDHFGFSTRQPILLSLVLPVLLLPLGSGLLRRKPNAFKTWTLRLAGILAFLSALAFAKLLNLRFWDTTDPLTVALVLLLGLSSLWMAVGTEDRWNPGLGLWLALWSYLGTWDPALRPLGLGVAAALAGWDRFPGSQPIPISQDPQENRDQSNGKNPRQSWSSLPFGILLGLALPKTAWDYGCGPASAWTLAAFGLGLTLSFSIAPLVHIRKGFLLSALALLFPCYLSVWPWTHGLALGLVSGLVLPRLQSLFPAFPLSFLLGLLISKALHANLQIPLLGKLCWWGS